MRHEDWVRYQKETVHQTYFEPFSTHAQQIVELRNEIANLSGRIKAELLAELSLEVERLIANYQRSVFSQPAQLDKQEKEPDYANQNQAAS